MASSSSDLKMSLLGSSGYKQLGEDAPEGESYARETAASGGRSWEEIAKLRGELKCVRLLSSFWESES